MSKAPVAYLFVIAVALTSGCAHPNRVLFFTKTSIGIDADTTPPTATISYDRIDGYLGPRYDSGAVPPVLASIQSDLAIFAPKIKQVYATGQAANNATSTEVNAPQYLPLSGKKELMFFGTSTTTGLKVGFTPNGAPNSVTLGYKRKEISVIPLQTIKCPNSDLECDTFPSVLASVDMRTSVASLDKTSLAMSQFFATGGTAEALANDASIRSQFTILAQNALQVVGPVPEDVQKHRKALADYVKTLTPAELDTLAQALHKPTGPDALTEVLKSISAATTAAQVDAIAQQIRILFGKDI